MPPPSRFFCIFLAETRKIPAGGIAQCKIFSVILSGAAAGYGSFDFVAYRHFAQDDMLFSGRFLRIAPTEIVLQQGNDGGREGS